MTDTTQEELEEFKAEVGAYIEQIMRSLTEVNARLNRHKHSEPDGRAFDPEKLIR